MKKLTITCAKIKDDPLYDDAYDNPEAKKLSAIVGLKLKATTKLKFDVVNGYSCWLQAESSEGYKIAEQFDKAVLKLLGSETYEHYDLKAMIQYALLYKLGQGPKIVNGVNVSLNFDL